MVKTKIGIALIILGAMLMISAAGIILYNNHIQNDAERSVENIIPQLAEKINNNIETTERLSSASYVGQSSPAPVGVREENETVMETVEVEEYEYIGMLSIPSLSLELPVMADWNKEKLNLSPCRYSGTVEGDDLVVMAHNYRRHFGAISRLNENDVIRFTDVYGNVTDYRVVVTDCLSAVAVDDMVAGEFDLTLFTCNYDGNSRITVRCDKA